MRAGQVVELKEDCVRYFEEYDSWVLKYEISKIIEAKRRKSLSDNNIVVIPEEIALKKLEQKDLTTELRVKYNIKHLIKINVLLIS